MQVNQQDNQTNTQGYSSPPFKKGSLLLYGKFGNDKTIYVYLGVSRKDTLRSFGEFQCEPEERVKKIADQTLNMFGKEAHIEKKLEKNGLERTFNALHYVDQESGNLTIFNQQLLPICHYNSKHKLRTDFLKTKGAKSYQNNTEAEFLKRKAKKESDPSKLSKHERENLESKRLGTHDFSLVVPVKLDDLWSSLDENRREVRVGDKTYKIGIDTFSTLRQVKHAQDQLKASQNKEKETETKKEI